MDRKLFDKLKKREEEGTIRSLSSYNGMVDFISNDYLGLSPVNFAGSDHSGSTGSRLISGNDHLIEKCEQELADFFGYPAALCFNSGYDANIGIFGAVPQRGDVVMYDEHIHASVRDGIRLGMADAYAFNHNDTTDLDRLLHKFSDRTIYVAIEGLYSMQGDVAPLEEISSLCEKHDARIILDEAHSGGVLGLEGKGITQLSKSINVYIKLVTFGKAFGGHGACVLTDEATRSFLINFARSFIYTTALPISEYHYMANVVHFTELSERRRKLAENIAYFRERLSALQLISDINSPIQIVRADLERLKHLESTLLEKKIAVKLIYHPTVKKGEECLRFCLHSFNTITELDLLASILLSK